MGFSRQQIEELAPDQASLTAASKLAKPAKWLSLHHEGDLWWGECQGSGSNPYRAVVDSGEVGYKCTCPSRKFPCKHALALMWLVADTSGRFGPGAVPQWVSDWLGRRRTTAVPAASDAPKPAKSLAMAETTEVEKPDDPAAQAKREAASAKRAENTRSMIADGLDELDQWITDQLASGVMAFSDNATERCRRIAARLVDHKAAGLASRLDEMPSRLIALPLEERPDAVIREFGKLVTLMAAWRADPAEPQAGRDVGAAERRDDVLANPDAPRARGRWEVLGEQVRTRRDGLVSHSTWFLKVDTPQPTFALLLDFFPASAGRREASFTTGAVYDATMVYYPSSAPLRALATDQVPVIGETPDWPGVAATDPLGQAMPALAAVPWQLEFPLLLPPGRVVETGAGLWWVDGESGAGLPLATGAIDKRAPAILGLPLHSAAGIWDGARLTLLAGNSSYGREGLA